MKTPPLFKDIYQFNVLMLITTKSFPKDFKFSLGNRINEHSLDALELINQSLFETNKEKIEFIEVIQKKMQRIRLLVRLSMDTKCINVEKFSFINEEIERILKQLYAWQKAQLKKTTPFS